MTIDRHSHGIPPSTEDKYDNDVIYCDDGHGGNLIVGCLFSQDEVQRLQSLKIKVVKIDPQDLDYEGNYWVAFVFKENERTSPFYGYLIGKRQVDLKFMAKHAMKGYIVSMTRVEMVHVTPSVISMHMGGGYNDDIIHAYFLEKKNILPIGLYKYWANKGDFHEIAVDDDWVKQYAMD